MLWLAIAPALLSVQAARPSDREREAERPAGVVLIMTDDQGYGDFGFHGNPVVRTPNLDALAEESARMVTFYVSPVCTPTRAALMTGRYCQRTRAIDTYLGRAMMDPSEVTVAEVLRDAGFATGIFGKWHLGDCYPMRAIDQGFQTALVHRGGGIGQPSDPPGGEGRYTDPVLFRDGRRIETKGYCTDVYFDAVIEFIRAQHAAERPFFAYVATNAPHGPFHDVPPGLLAEYRALELERGDFPQESGHPLPAYLDPDRLARILAMITNVDENVGRLLAALEELGIAEDTLVLFLVDNGPNTRRYVAGMRGMKSEVHEGGVRSPLWLRWPARLEAGRTSDRISAHVDVMPTILDACGVDTPAEVELDGRSLLPLLVGDEVDWPDRALFVQAHRGDVPVRYHNFLLRTQRWKLLSPSGFQHELESVEPSFELYDMQADPLELLEVSDEHPDVVAELRARYDAWFDGLGTDDPARFEPPRIVIGAEEAPVVTLTRQDWRRLPEGRGDRNASGQWLASVVDEGPYDVHIRFRREVARASLGSSDGAWTLDEETTSLGEEHVLEHVPLPLGPLDLVVTGVEGDPAPHFAHQVTITRSPAVTDR